MGVNYSEGMNNIKNAFKNIKIKLIEKKDFLVIKCPNCSQKLRLPRRKGNILVTCPRCSFKFKLKT